MRVKRLLSLFLFLAALALPALVLGQGARTYAVLPFKVNSDKFQYMSRGAQSMLSSRLAWLGNFEPIAQANVDRAGSRYPAGPADAQSLLAQVGSDYLVAGNIDFKDNQANIEVRVYDKKGATWTKTAQSPLDGLVPALERISSDIRAEVFKRPGDDAKAAERKENKKEQQARAPVPRNADFVGGDANEAPVASGPVMNPQCRYEGGSETPGRWQSQSFRFTSVGMAIGNINGDGKNRIVIASQNKLYAFEYFKEGEQRVLKPAGEQLITNRFRVLRVSTLDIARKGRANIIVSGLDDPDGQATPRSYIYEYHDGKFEQIAVIPQMYLAVVRTPPMYQPNLICQSKGFHGNFEEGGVYECDLSNGEIIKGHNLKLPPFSNVFNIAFLPEGKTYKTIMINDYGNIKVFTPDLEPQAVMEEAYNTSPNFVVTDDRLPGLDTGKRDDATAVFYYLPMHSIVTDFGNRGKYELLVNKDISVASQIFQKYRRFSQGEVHSLFWDGVGMSLAWKTRRIKGTVADIAVEDLMGTGQSQLVVCLNTYSSATGMGNEKTVVVAYDLNMNQ